MTVNDALLQFLTSLPEAEQAGMALAIDRAMKDFELVNNTLPNK